MNHRKSSPKLNQPGCKTIFHSNDNLVQNQFMKLPDPNHSEPTPKDHSQWIALTQFILDSIAANLVMVDQEGHIVTVNRSWIQFAEGIGNGSRWAGCDSENFCQLIFGSNSQESSLMQQGIQAVLGGKQSDW